jgi:hypothetical protein
MRGRRNDIRIRAGNRVLHDLKAHERLVHDRIQGEQDGVWYVIDTLPGSYSLLGFIVWAKEQIETFADMFRRQVYAPTIPEGVSDECMRVVASHNRKVRLICPNPKHAC